MKYSESIRPLFALHASHGPTPAIAAVRFALFPGGTGGRSGRRAGRQGATGGRDDLPHSGQKRPPPGSYEQRCAGAALRWRGTPHSLSKGEHSRIRANREPALCGRDLDFAHASAQQIAQAFRHSGLCGRRRAAAGAGFAGGERRYPGVLSGLEARTGRRVEYQDDEARKAGKG